jgi:hypothetical protein
MLCPGLCLSVAEDWSECWNNWTVDVGLRLPHHRGCVPQRPVLMLLCQRLNSVSAALPQKNESGKRRACNGRAGCCAAALREGPGTGMQSKHTSE